MFPAYSRLAIALLIAELVAGSAVNQQQAGVIAELSCGTTAASEGCTAEGGDLEKLMGVSLLARKTQYLPNEMTAKTSNLVSAVASRLVAQEDPEPRPCDPECPPPPCCDPNQACEIPPEHNPQCQGTHGNPNGSSGLGGGAGSGSEPAAYESTGMEPEGGHITHKYR